MKKVLFILGITFTYSVFGQNYTADIFQSIAENDRVVLQLVRTENGEHYTLETDTQASTYLYLSKYSETGKIQYSKLMSPYFTCDAKLRYKKSCMLVIGYTSLLRGHFVFASLDGNIKKRLVNTTERYYDVDICPNGKIIVFEEYLRDYALHVYDGVTGDEDGDAIQYQISLSIVRSSIKMINDSTLILIGNTFSGKDQRDRIGVTSLNNLSGNKNYDTSYSFEVFQTGPNIDSRHFAPELLCYKGILYGLVSDDNTEGFHKTRKIAFDAYGKIIDNDTYQTYQSKEHSNELEDVQLIKISTLRKGGESLMFGVSESHGVVVKKYNGALLIK